MSASVYKFLGISDLGLAKILNPSPAQITQRITTQAPGTPCYMPPETLVSKPSYTSKVDSYSYGVLMIHILCGEWPFPGDMFTEAPNAPSSLLPVSEFDRRREHLLKIGLDHPLMGLIRQCLSNAPSSRPEVSEILDRIEDLKSSLPPSPFESILEMIHQIQSRCEDTDGKQLSNQGSSPPNNIADKSPLRQIVKSLTDESKVQRNRIETLTRQNEARQSRIELMTREIQILRQHSESQGQKIVAQRDEIESKTREVQDLRRQTESQGRQMEVQRGEIESSMREVQHLRQHSKSQSREVKAQKNEIEAKTSKVTSQNREILSLREQLEKLSTLLPSPFTNEPPPCFLIYPDTRIKWRRCADLPVAMSQHQLVLFKGMVYAGGGYTGPGNSSRLENFLVFQYDHRRDVWVTLAPCLMRLFTLSQFQGQLIAVGGFTDQDIPSNKVYRYVEESKEWEKYLKPMPTARVSLSVFTTPSAIITCGGGVGYQKNFATVEVYAAETGQWHTADPLPNPYADTTSAIIDDTCYLLGGHDRSDSSSRIVLCAQVSSLIKSATSPPGRFAKAFKTSPWKTLPETPLFFSSAASVGGRLLAVGGRDSEHHRSAATLMFVPVSKAWIRMPSGDLPIAVSSPAAIELPGMNLLVCGGWRNRGQSNAVFVGSFAE